MEMVPIHASGSASSGSVPLPPHEHHYTSTVYFWLPSRFWRAVLRTTAIFDHPLTPRKRCMWAVSGLVWYVWTLLALVPLIFAMKSPASIARWVRPGLDRLGVAPGVLEVVCYSLQSLIYIVADATLLIGTWNGVGGLRFSPAMLKLVDVKELRQKILSLVNATTVSFLINYIVYLGLTSIYYYQIGFLDTRFGWMFLVVMVLVMMVAVPVAMIQNGFVLIVTETLTARFKALNKAIREQNISADEAMVLVGDVLTSMQEFNVAIGSHFIAFAVTTLASPTIMFFVFLFANANWYWLVITLQLFAFLIAYFVPFAKLNAFKDALKEVIGRVEMRRAQGVTPAGAIPWDKQSILVLSSIVEHAKHSELVVAGSKITTTMIYRLFYVCLAINVFLYNSSALSLRALVGLGTASGKVA